ncbi:MAG: OmpA family protein [Polyangiaceae bacterium]|nr:OmpA family protein [Polyangiaceae bacterium]
MHVRIVAATFALAALVACAAKPAPMAPDSSQARAVIAPQRAGDNVQISKEVEAKCGIPSEHDAPRFDFDSARLVAERSSALDALARCLSAGALKSHSIQLVGRADPRGDTEYNIALGAYRAESVAEYLRSHGVTATQISVTSRGDLDAVGYDEDTWAVDRRVDVKLPPES